MTRATVRALDWLAIQALPADKRSAHLHTGWREEEDAYFYLRTLGYVIVEPNFGTPRRRCEIDLIGWDQDILAFIEVRTRITRDVKPAEVAVDRDKQREISLVAREYLRRVPPSCQWRFDVVSVYYDGQTRHPQFELFKNAFPAE